MESSSMFKKTLAAALILGLASTGAQAADWDVSGYIQGNIGQSKAEKPSFVKREAQSLPGTTKSDSKDTAYKLIVGLQLNPYVALEAQYVDLGKANYKIRSAGNENKIRTSTKGLGANLVGTLPIESFTLFAKAGLHNMETKLSDKTNLGYSASGTTRQWTPSYGIGASYEFVENLAAVVEYERYHKAADDKAWAGYTKERVSVKHDIDMFSAGIRYKF